MNLRFWAIFVILCAQAAIADQLVCIQPGNTVSLNGAGTCTLTGPPINLSQAVTPFQYQTIVGGRISNGVFSAEYIAESLSLPDNISGASFPMSASVTWNDSFGLPSSNPSDVLDISVRIQGLFGAADVHIGPVPNLNYNTLCDFHVSGDLCTTNNTVSAGGINYVDVSGTHLYSLDSQGQGGPGGANASDLAVEVSINRFLADGTTPDPFSTPEPSGLGVMAGLSGLVLGSWQSRRSKRLRLR